MKTFKKITILMMLLTTTVGCERTFETKNVEISLNRELIRDFLEEYAIERISGDITYKAKKEIALQEDRRYIYGDPGDYCPDEDEYETVKFFNIDSIGDKQDYLITSYENGGFKLAVKSSAHEDDTYFKRYLYKSITFVHPLYMPHDSIVCTNVRYEGHEYGIGLDEYASRPCSGKIKVYRVNGDETYLSKEMVEASNEKTVWKEYYANGNVKSIKTIVANPEDVDENGFAAKPFVTNIEYYLEDGTPSDKSPEEYYAAYQELLRAGAEFENACNIYNRELNMIADKATSSAYSGVYAQKIFWDCDDAFQLVEKKGAAFARAMRKCGQEDNARELERRLKADRRKYNSYKDEVNHMLGVY